MKDFPTLRAFAAAEPHALGDLLGRLSRLMAGYLVRQGEAGADAVQVFDSWRDYSPAPIGNVSSAPTWRPCWRR